MHHFAKRLVCVVTAAALTAGCGTSGVWPVVPKYDRKELIAQGQLPAAHTVEDVRKLSGKWHELMYEAGRDRDVQRVVQNEILFYGTLMLTGGALMFAKEGKAIWQSLRNIGGATAIGSDLIGGHYQPGDQSMAFRKAETQMACLIDALQPIPGETVYQTLFTADEKDKVNRKLETDKFPDPDIDNLYAAVPRLTLHFIEHQVIPTLRADLQAITLGTPSREELMSRLDQFREKQTQGTNAANALPPPVPASAPASAPADADVNTLRAALTNADSSAHKKAVQQFEKELREKIEQEEKAKRTSEELNRQRKLAIKALTTYSTALTLCKPV